MAVYAQSVQQLIDELGRLPGVGPKSAQRIAYHLLRLPAEDARRLADSIEEVKRRITFCRRCFDIAETDGTAQLEGVECGLCQDSRREDGVLCVVEEPKDVVAVEKTHRYRGRYHVLQGHLDPIRGVGGEQLRIAELVKRIDDESITEVIVCTNPNIEGEATALYVAKEVRERHAEVNVTRIASGLPVGGDLEYADELTLGRALEGRTAL
ncbi:MAG TPA: recombination mediator RecR [Acidimicrobiales bacterium]|nr:recombination mediator RecR [Acidimicrobiales bacterium]